jgi:hypothetical protein
MSVDLGNVSAIPFSERQNHYLDSFGGDNIQARAEMLEMSYAMAMGEMVDEIHTMLRFQCGIADQE